MRFVNLSAVSLLFGAGLSLVGATGSVGCSGEGFDGCKASKTCPASTGGAGSGSKGGEAGDNGDGHGAGGSGGTSGAGAAGKAGKGGSGGVAGSAAGGKGGVGGAKQDDSKSDAGSDDGKDTAGRSGSGGRDDGHHEPDQGEAGMGGEAGAKPEPEPADTTPPTIIEKFPQHEAVGVLADTQIFIKFSEPMNKAETEAAFSSPELDSARLLWDDDSTLVVQPREPLQYAEMTDPTVPAAQYSVTIAAGAKDAAGNPLGHDESFTFSTLRHVTQTLQLPALRAHKVVKPADGKPVVPPGTRCGSPSKSLFVGDDDGNDGVGALLDFDLKEVPEGVTEWLSARLAATMKRTVDPPVGRLGNMFLYGLVVDNVDGFIWDQPSSTDQLSDFAWYNDQTASDRNVRDAIAGDYKNREDRGNHSQFYLRFQKMTDDNGQETGFDLLCGDLRLELQYLAP